MTTEAPPTKPMLRVTFEDGRIVHIRTEVQIHVGQVLPFVGVVKDVEVEEE